MKKKRRALPLVKRELIVTMSESGYGVRTIGRVVDVSPSVVSRELRRNRPTCRLRLRGRQRAEWAHARAKRRLKERKRGKRSSLKLVVLRTYIVKKLTEKISPEAIAATMEEEIGQRVSCSTIYRWIKEEGAALTQYLYERGKKRRQRVMDRRGRFQQAAAAKRPIETRPSEAEARSEIGHLEGDTIHGCKGTTAAILSIRDRKSRRHWFEKVENLESETVTRAIIRLLHKIPRKFHKTLTFDRGAEFADWRMIEKIFEGLQVYFCDPYCPYQKGSNERGNRDFRKYYPKGSNFELITEEQVREAANKINLHPMKLHGWRSPIEVYEEECLKTAA